MSFWSPVHVHMQKLKSLLIELEQTTAKKFEFFLWIKGVIMSLFGLKLSSGSWWSGGYSEGSVMENCERMRFMLGTRIHPEWFRHWMRRSVQIRPIINTWLSRSRFLKGSCIGEIYSAVDGPSVGSTTGWVQIQGLDWNSLNRGSGGEMKTTKSR